MQINTLQNNVFNAIPIVQRLNSQLSLCKLELLKMICLNREAECQIKWRYNSTNYLLYYLYKISSSLI